MFERTACAAVLMIAGAAVSNAEDAPIMRAGLDLFDSSRLLATGGVSQVEGSGGGGLTPWAVITGYGSRDAIGGNIHSTTVRTDDYLLQTAGAAIGLFDRVEVSFTRQWFDTRQVGADLGLGYGYTFEQDIVGLKVRLLGDAVYGQDTLLPQVAVGVQYKKNNRGDLLSALGAGDDEGIDYYLSATKLFLAESLLLNATLRYTKANQFGLLGFGGDLEDDYTVQFEGSVAYLLSKHLAIGGEYRMKPDNLGFAAEDDAFDVFVAWFPTKNLSFTVAYADLGDIATYADQRGLFLSIQAGF